jgi:hypothetical protein
VTEICIELGCDRSAQADDGYCVEHRAQFWPLWAAHPLDEPCPPGCSSRLAEIADFYREGWGREATAAEIANWDRPW